MKLTPADVLELARSVRKHPGQHNASTVALALEIIRLREGLGKPAIYRVLDNLPAHEDSPYQCADAILRSLGLVP